MTLSDFLLARIAEDEAVANAAKQAALADGRRSITGPQAVTELVERFRPTRVLAECRAKRRIVECYGATESVGSEMAETMGAAHYHDCQFLAAVYADHPDYRAEWATTNDSAPR